MARLDRAIALFIALLLLARSSRTMTLQLARCPIGTRLVVHGKLFTIIARSGYHVLTVEPTLSGLIRRDPVNDAFAYHDHRCMGTTRPWNARHYRCISDRQPRNTLYSAILVHDR